VKLPGAGLRIALGDPGYISGMASAGRRDRQPIAVGEPFELDDGTSVTARRCTGASSACRHAGAHVSSDGHVVVAVWN
jgi:hypothetical protein